MSVFKSLVDRVQAKKDELERRAAKKAAEKATELAIERGKQAARAVVDQAGEALKSAGASIEDALFGPEGDSMPQAKPDREPRRDDAPTASRDRERQARARVEAEARLQRDVDDELAAMKRRMGRP
jgi:hypothetical protein